MYLTDKNPDEHFYAVGVFALLSFKFMVLMWVRRVSRKKLPDIAKDLTTLFDKDSWGFILRALR